VPERRLTVSWLWRRKAGRYPASYAGDDVVPYVRLSGRWLEELGFHPGERLRVEEAPGRLVLTPAVSASEVAEGPAAEASRPGAAGGPGAGSGQGLGSRASGPGGRRRRRRGGR
jgi:Toxin SymE, type I toxin-antitoxin system